MVLRERGETPNDRFKDTPFEGADIGNIPPEIVEQALEQAKILKMLIEQYIKLMEDPTNETELKKYISMLRDIIKGPTKVAVTILGAGISAMYAITSKGE